MPQEFQTRLKAVLRTNELRNRTRSTFIATVPVLLT
jgi:hypothetical protein